MDLTLSAFGLIVLAIPLAVVAVLVKTTSKGPILFPLTWAGQGGKPFVGYKIRTMITGAEAMEKELQAHNEMVGPAFKMENDPRITSIGHVLRKYSIDELPQLWSVLKGDLSLVGPRPPRMHEYAQFTEFQKQKMAVKPGMTCLWQVSGRHKINDYDDWVKMDLEYIRRWSLWLDIQILAKTALVVLQGTGK